jgi:hypothetical protein
LFLGSYQENQNIDRDVLVVSDGGEGSSVSQLLTYFESVWSQPENKTITGKTSSQTDALQERYAALCAVHGKEQLNLALAYALSINTYSFKSIESILSKKVYLLATPIKASNTAILNTHQNLRGKEYYQ